MKNVEVIMRLWYNFPYKIIHPDHMNLIGLRYVAAVIYVTATIIYYRSFTDTVITETNGGDRMDTTKIRTDEE